MNNVGVLLLGLVVGIFGGMFGLGGGIIMVPLLLFLFKKDVHTATATSLAVIGPMALSGSISNIFTGNISYAAFIFMSLGSMGGAYLGASWQKKVPQEILRKILGIAVLLVSLTLLFRFFNSTAGIFPAEGMVFFGLLLIFGVFVGIFSGMLGLGGGIIMLPLLMTGFGFTAHMATATSLAIIVPTSIAGSVKNYKTGTLDTLLFIRLAIGAVLGSTLGTIIAQYIANDDLKRLVGIVVFLISLSILFKKSKKQLLRV